MTPATVDPRVIAESLQIGTDDLAAVLTKWASESFPVLSFEARWEPPSLDYFDSCVERARNYLVAAHEAMKAWNEDNPYELDDPEKTV